jgi:hypothetical protein
MKGLPIVLLAVATLGMAPAPAAGQEGRIFISLVDRTGAPVTDLRPEELAIVMDGEELQILRLESIDWPMKLTVLVDNGPASSNALLHLRNGLQGFFERLPAGIDIELLTMSPQPRWIVRPTRDHQALIESIPRITPDSAAPKFIEALNEVAERIAEDDGNYFPVVVIIGSDGPEGSAVFERDVNRMATRLVNRAATLHVVMMALGGRRTLTTTGANQVQVGIQLAELTGGRYENIASSTRLATLLPEFADVITRSHRRQSQQYRITYDAPSIPRPSDARPGDTPSQISAGTTRTGLSGILTFDGHIPQP